jgi:hypothetical protein
VVQTFGVRRVISVDRQRLVLKPVCFLSCITRPPSSLDGGLSSLLVCCFAMRTSIHKLFLPGDFSGYCCLQCLAGKNQAPIKHQVQIQSGWDLGSTSGFVLTV